MKWHPFGLYFINTYIVFIDFCMWYMWYLVFYILHFIFIIQSPETESLPSSQFQPDESQSQPDESQFQPDESQSQPDESQPDDLLANSVEAGSSSESVFSHEAMNAMEVLEDELFLDEVMQLVNSAEAINGIDFVELAEMMSSIFLPD